MGEQLRLLCWNVNGVRACVRHGMMRWLRAQRADIVCLQEVRALPEQWPAELRRARWHITTAVAERPGYSGVAILSRRKPDAVERQLAPPFDREGRMVSARFGRLLVCSAYFPKGDGPNRDMSRLPYKLAFYEALRAQLQAHRRRGLRVLCAGDFNTAHRAIDLARPRQNRHNGGFRPDEREALDAWMRAGFVDTFRAFEPGGGHYTWWSQRQGVRERNIGWRLDYVLASRAAMRFVTGAFIQPGVRGSDHCPIGITMRSAAVD